jgi:hypothetical protein
LEVQNQTKGEKQANAFHLALARLAQLAGETAWITKSAPILEVDGVFLGMNGVPLSWARA